MPDEQSSRTRVTRRRLLAGLGAVGVAGAASGAGSFALFGDQRSSSGNGVRAGTIDLELENQPDRTYTQGVTGTFKLANGKPGDTFDGDVNLQNTGSVDADHAQIRFGAKISGPDRVDSGDDPALEMAQQFGVTFFSYPKSTVPSGHVTTSSLNDGSDGLLTLADLVDGTNDAVLDDLKPAPRPNGSRALSLAFEWLDDQTHPNLDYPNNTFQGDTLTVTITFALAQKPGQQVLQ